MLGIRLQMRLEAVEEGIGLPALVMQARSCRNPRSAILALAVHNTPHGSSAKGGVNRLRFSRSPGPGNENRHLQHKQRQQEACQSPRLAAHSSARRSLSSGAESDRFGISGSGDREGRLRRDLARAKVMERRRHTCS